MGMLFGSVAFAAGSHPYLVNLGAGGAPFFFRGFYDLGGAGIGSTTPAAIQINGEELVGLYSSNDGGVTYDVAVTVDDATETVAQTHFTGIILQDSDGDFRQYMTADATFVTGGSPPVAQWEWGTGADDAYVISPTVDPTQFSILL